MSFAINREKNIGKNINKDLSIKFSQKLLDHAKQSATDAIKTASKRGIQKTAVATGNLNGNKIADSIAKVSRTSLKINSVTNGAENIRLERELHWERYIYPEQRQKNIDDLRLYNNNLI